MLKKIIGADIKITTDKALGEAFAKLYAKVKLYNYFQKC